MKKPVLYRCKIIFQFHKGTIKTLVRQIYAETLVYFNSIKVRLKLYLSKNLIYKTNSFQFHKGTIKTDLSFTSKFTASVFQFHKGTIKTILMMKPHILVLSHFNSIKVRLKLKRHSNVSRSP